MKLELERGLGEIETNYHSSYCVAPLLLILEKHL